MSMGMSMGMDGDSQAGAGPHDGGEMVDLVTRLLAGAGNCPVDVVEWARALVAVTARPVVGDLATVAGLADRVTVLARVRTVLDAEIARTLVAAETADVLPHAPVTHLQRAAAWSGADASQVVAAGRMPPRSWPRGGWRRGIPTSQRCGVPVKCRRRWWR